MDVKTVISLNINVFIWYVSNVHLFNKYTDMNVGLTSDWKIRVVKECHVGLQWWLPGGFSLADWAISWLTDHLSNSLQMFHPLADLVNTDAKLLEP